MQVIAGVYPGVTTCELDELAAQTAAYMATQHRKSQRGPINQSTREKSERGVLSLCMAVGCCMTIDPRIPTMPGRSTLGFHQPGRESDGGG